MREILFAFLGALIFWVFGDAVESAYKVESQIPEAQRTLQADSPTPPAQVPEP